MKQSKVLLFFLSVFLMLFIVWLVYPVKGVQVGDLKLRFPSYQAYLADLQDSTEDVNVDSVLLAVQKSYEMVEGSTDTLRYYYDYITSNPNRICLPEDDYTFFDSLFVEMAAAADSGCTVRILHYGDSQLEMDRILGCAEAGSSGTLRRLRAGNGADDPADSDRLSLAERLRKPDSLCYGGELADKEGSAQTLRSSDTVH